MGETTGIAWTTHTFNPWWGCEKVSAGCRNCYAEGFAVKRMGLPIWGGEGTGRRFFGDNHWKDPVRWNRAAEKAGKPARVFCASMADVFEDRPDLVGPRVRLFALIRVTPWLIWQLLTKRPENMVRLAPPEWANGWPPNVWAGTTCEDQENAEERIPHLLRVPAAVRFLSVEPQVGPVNLDPPTCPTCGGHDAVTGDDGATPFCREHGDEMGFGAWLDPCSDANQPGISWVIQGGESGPKARPFDLAWARSLRDQCRAAGVAYFLKQLGARPFDTINCGRLGHGDHRCDYSNESLRVRLADSHGADESEWPEDLWGRRAFPEVRP